MPLALSIHIYARSRVYCLNVSLYFLRLWFTWLWFFAMLCSRIFFFIEKCAFSNVLNHYENIYNNTLKGITLELKLNRQQMRIHCV